METITIKELQKELLNLKKDVEYIKEHLDEEPKGAYIKKIRSIEQRGKFIDVADFAKEFGLK